MNVTIRYTRPKNCDPKKHKLTKKVTYEFIEDLWELIKEYAVTQVVEPIKIGEYFLCYKTYNGEVGRELNSVELCMRVEDQVTPFEHQKHYHVPIIYGARYVAIQSLKTKGVTNPKWVISRKKNDEDIREFRKKFSTTSLFAVRRSVVGANQKTMYWDRPDWKTTDKRFSEYQINKTYEPTQLIQFVKTKETKLTRGMFPEWNLWN
jgi:hypothetical protein